MFHIFAEFLTFVRPQWSTMLLPKNVQNVRVREKSLLKNVTF